MMMTEMDIETSVYYVHLTRLIARKDFIKYRFRYLTSKIAARMNTLWYRMEPG
jgi:hypothetical protein